ncbi:MAG: Loki-CTERM sorting domain-containing protein [Candidatus Odinarchaeota archaeon]
MIRNKNILPIVVLGLTLAILFAPLTAQALPDETYIPGSEAAIFDGHTFAEAGGWTSEVNITDDETGNWIQLFMHHVNHGSFQAGLLALGDVYIAENDTHATLPYQLFGIHFTTPTGRELFAAANFAFLFAFNDTDGSNTVNQPEEERWFVIPYGWDGGNKTATPVVSAITMDTSTPGEYRFGVKYENLYARIVGGNLLEFLITLNLPLFEIQISELTFEYVITVDDDTGEITTKTDYTIGQVQAFYALGQEIPIGEVHTALQNVTIGAAHFISVFGSNYYKHTGNQLTPRPASQWIAANITTDAAGRQRAFAVGIRGTWEKYNETPTGNDLLSDDNIAYSWILQPALLSPETLLLLWQLPLSADFFATWAYAVGSPTFQSLYEGPLDVYENATLNFNTVAFWYAVTFPKFGGYRVEHDPVYTAYSNIGQAAPGIPGFPWEAILIGVVVCLVAVFLVRRRKKV